MGAVFKPLLLGRSKTVIANFSQGNLRQANLVGANLKNTYFEGAALAHADLY